MNNENSENPKNENNQEESNQNENKPERSEHQKDASRENGKKSQGPKTPDGKAKSSQNAMKHGLTAKTTNPDLLVLSDEDREEFNAFQDRFVQGMAPEDPAEEELIKGMVAANWRMTRIMGIETELLEKDRYKKLYIPVIAKDPTTGQNTLISQYHGTEDRGLSHSYAKNGKDLDRLHKYERMLFNAFHRSLRLLYQNKLSKQKLETETRKENSKNEPKKASPIAKTEPAIPEADTTFPQRESTQANPETIKIQNEPKPAQQPAAKPQGLPTWEPSPGHPDYKPMQEKTKTNPRKHYFTDLFQALTSGILPPPFPKMA